MCINLASIFWIRKNEVFRCIARCSCLPVVIPAGVRGLLDIDINFFLERRIGLENEVIWYVKSDIKKDTLYRKIILKLLIFLGGRLCGNDDEGAARAFFLPKTKANLAT